MSPLATSHHGFSVALGGDVVDPSKLLRRRSSLVIADLPVHEQSFKLKAKGSDNEKRPSSSHEPPPSIFVEPEANSLLDSFGF